MATIGRIQHFNQAVESWDQYAERMGHFFDANGILILPKNSLHY